jgi:hypothetical protein
LHRDPNQRWQTAQQVIEALDRLPLNASEEMDACEAASSAGGPEPEPAGAGRAAQSEAQAAVLEATDEPSGPLASETAAAGQAERSLPGRRPKGTVAWAAVAIGLAVLGGAAGLLLRATRSSEPAAVRGPQTQPAPSRQTAASAASSTTFTASASAIPSAGVPRAEALAWRHRLEAAERVKDWTNAYRAFEKLARSAPAAFREPLVIASAARTLSALTQSGLPETEAMMATLEQQLGSAGPDVLFHVVQFHGGSRAHERALASLAKPQVLALASGELRLALELRQAGCKTSPAALRQAVQTGDGRALMVLKVQRSTCRPSYERDAAYRKLEARLTRP